MMVEVFKYTERVVNMARPRKLLMMAIGSFYSSHYSLTTDYLQMVSHLEPK
jgi:hypothetical protein